MYSKQEQYLIIVKIKGGEIIMFKETKNYNKLFVVNVFAVFWLSILLTGLVLMLMGEKAPMQLMTTICAWTPTIVLLIMFNKLLPNTTRREYFKNLFREKIKWTMVFFVTFIQLLIVLISAYTLSLLEKTPLLSLLNLSIPILSQLFFVSLTTGATGEESAWRGYLFPVIKEKSGVIKGSLLLGLIWFFWHVPLYIATSGFMGTELVIYLSMSLLFIVSTSVIICVCYEYNRNLFIPIWIHLMVNFSFGIVAVNLENAITFVAYITILYIVTAFGFYLWYKKFNKEVVL